MKETFSARLSYPVTVQVPAGTTLYVRVYAWNASAIVGKMLAVYGVKVAGSVVSQTATAAPVDKTSSFTALRSGLTWNRITNKYSGSITLTNASGAAMSGPFQVSLENLPEGVTLDNASGIRNSAPYITLAANSIGPGASVTVPLVFANPNRVAIGYKHAVLIGTF